MTYCFDLDGTLTRSVKANGAWVSEYLPYRISVVNKLYDDGHTIIIHTARKWADLMVTLSQLRLNGVKYHTIVMGKPVADCYIDDKGTNDVDFF